MRVRGIFNGGLRYFFIELLPSLIFLLGRLLVRGKDSGSRGRVAAGDNTLFNFAVSPRISIERTYFLVAKARGLNLVFLDS